MPTSYPDLPGIENLEARLLACLQDFAPDNIEKGRCEASIDPSLRETSRHGLGNVLMLTGMLYDGLQWGNWPWSK